MLLYDFIFDQSNKNPIKLNSLNIIYVIHLKSINLSENFVSK